MYFKGEKGTKRKKKKEKRKKRRTQFENYFTSDKIVFE